MDDHDRPAIVIITGRANPTLSPSDQLYHAALERLGANVRIEQWNGDRRATGADLARAGAVVLRSPWDYHGDLDRFLGWLDEIETAGVRLHNPAPLVRWNVDKRYLLDLQRSGVLIPPTAVVEPGVASRGLDEAYGTADVAPGEPAVIKPAWGGSGFGVELASRAEAEAVLAGAWRAAPGRPMLIQQFLAGIGSAGETSLVFIDGTFSHAVVKRPAPGEFRTNAKFAPLGRLSVVPPAETIAAALMVIDSLPVDAAPLYARIDGVPDAAGRFVCMEAEVIDPGLFMDSDTVAAEWLAEATLRRAV